MKTVEALMEAHFEDKVQFKAILYLTDFSEPSEIALPFALAMARECRAKVVAFHVMILPPYIYTTPDLTAVGTAAQEDQAQAEMRRVDSQLAGLPHEAMVERATTVWGPVKLAIEKRHVDLIVLGTHGRTGVPKFFLGSVAEEIFRRSAIPVLTIGPGVRGGTHTEARFHRVLFATDFSPEAAAAAPYAISLVQKDGAQLIVVHVIPKPRSVNASDAPRAGISVAEAMHKMFQIPKDAGFSAVPSVRVEYGEPADRIVEVARECGADIIVLGRIGPAAHLERATAHMVVVHAGCPVLTV